MAMLLLLLLRGVGRERGCQRGLRGKLLRRAGLLRLLLSYVLLLLLCLLWCRLLGA